MARLPSVLTTDDFSLAELSALRCDGEVVAVGSCYSPIDQPDGAGIRATAQDPETAVLMGVNTNSVVMLTFLIGGLMAGAAAFFYVLVFETTNYFVGFVLGIKAFTAAVLGGIGNIRGALLGGFVLGLVENWGASMVGSQWKDVIAFTVLVVILLFRPTGILGESLQEARA